MLHTCFRFVRETLHLHKIYREKSHLVPHVKYDVDLLKIALVNTSMSKAHTVIYETYLSKEIALGVPFEIQLSIGCLTYVQIVFSARRS